MNRLRLYLLGLRFTVVTDFQSLVYLNIHKTVNPQIARWFEVLRQFDFYIKFRPGMWMAHVDALSRGAPPSSATDQVRFMQQADSFTRELIKLVTHTAALSEHEKRVVN